ncbi:MAG: type I-E CRISPR-associated protein Cse2/CasB [Stellaceae bacterium]
MTNDVSASDEGGSRLGAVLARLSAVLRGQNLGTGTEAALRRLDARRPDPRHAISLHRLFAEHGISPATPDLTVRWSAIVNALALCRGAHQRNRPCGEALHEIGVSEQRLAMLLAADCETLIDLLPRLARRLFASGQGMDWWPLARLTLTVGSNPDEADRMRSRIARDYVRAQVRDSNPAAA